MKRLIPFILFLLIATNAVFAKVSLEVTVLDELGKPMPNVLVTAKSLDGYVWVNASTDDKGKSVLSINPITIYNCFVEADGYLPLSVMTEVGSADKTLVFSYEGAKTLTLQLAPFKDLGLGVAVTNKENTSVTSNLKVADGICAVKVKPGVYIYKAGPDNDGMNDHFMPIVDSVTITSNDVVLNVAFKDYYLAQFKIRYPSENFELKRGSLTIYKGKEVFLVFDDYSFPDLCFYMPAGEYSWNYATNHTESYTSFDPGEPESFVLDADKEIVSSSFDMGDYKRLEFMAEILGNTNVYLETEIFNLATPDESPTTIWLTDNKKKETLLKSGLYRMGFTPWYLNGERIVPRIWKNYEITGDRRILFDFREVLKYPFVNVTVNQESSIVINDQAGEEMYLPYSDQTILAGKITPLCFQNKGTYTLTLKAGDIVNTRTIAVGDTNEPITVDMTKVDTGIEQMSGNEPQFSICLLPDGEKAVIMMTGVVNKGVIYLYSSNGLLIQTQDFEADKTVTLNLIGYPKGIYLLKIRSANKCFSHKFMK